MANHKHINLNNRRNFLRKLAGAGCASLTLSPLLSGITNLGLINAAAGANQSIFSDCSDYKALVCIMLAGGNDSFNMLAPHEQSQHTKYAELRGGVHNSVTNPTGMALKRDDLNVLDFMDDRGFEYGIHPQMNKIWHLFNGTDPDNSGNPVDQYVSFVANVGTLVQPLANLTDYRNLERPKQLFSHSNQSTAWQTGFAQGGIATGWAGRAADILRDCNDYKHISMNISLNGLNLFQRGEHITEYVIQSTGNGSIPLIDNFFHKVIDPTENNFYYATRDSTMNDILESTYQNILEKAYANKMSKALGASDAFGNAISSYNTVFTHEFPSTSIGQQLEMVAKSIATRNNLDNGGIKRQTFFVVMGGFDNHSDLIGEHKNRMQELDAAIYAFYKAMKQIGDSEKVTGFTMSDFARTLGSNGDGSDHAWGGHHMVFGGAVNGGNIFGDYPNLLDNDLDVGNGRFIPTRSCDEYFADLALWFGAEASDLETILPNIREFWTPTGTSGPLGLFV